MFVKKVTCSDEKHTSDYPIRQCTAHNTPQTKKKYMRETTKFPTVPFTAGTNLVTIARQVF